MKYHLNFTEPKKFDIHIIANYAYSWFILKPFFLKAKEPFRKDIVCQILIRYYNRT